MARAKSAAKKKAPARAKAAPRAKGAAASKKTAAPKKTGKGKGKGKASPATAAPKQRAVAAPKKSGSGSGSGSGSTGPELGTLRSCIYQVDDLEKAKAFYSAATGREPYFDEPFYVGFDLGGFELGLDPDVSKRQPGSGGTCGYWTVADINETWKHLTSIGAQSIELPHNVGNDTQVSVVADPFGNYIGLIQEG